MQIFNQDTFDCAINLIKQHYHPVCLDFASGSNAGGSWRSKQQGTQEESLCRRSNLGLLLEKEHYPMSRDSLIYLPNVKIIKKFDMNNIKSVDCAVIASELRGISASSNQYVESRILSLYNTAINNKHDVIILGAWGCGAFAESDDDVVILANTIKKLAKAHENKIKTVCAILGRKQYKIFNKILKSN